MVYIYIRKLIRNNVFGILILIGKMLILMFKSNHNEEFVEQITNLSI